MKFYIKELEDAMLYFAKMYNKLEPYSKTILFTEFSNIEKRLESIIFLLFINEFDYTFYGEEQLKQYKIILLFAKGLEEKGFLPSIVEDEKWKGY